MHPCDGKQVESGVNWQNVQAILRWGLSSHPFSALVTGVDPTPDGLGTWLAENVALVGTASMEEVSALDVVHCVGISYPGLCKLGVSGCEGFPFEFTQGMQSPRASLVLGDAGESSPANWRWGGDEEGVDFALLVFAKSETCLSAELDRLERVTAHFRTCVVIASRLQKHEHFGFRDGLSNPRIRGASSRGGAQRDEVAPGEFIFGYADERGNFPPPPLVLAQDRFRGLARSTDHDGMLELGRDGSFLVIRQLRQYPQAFERFLEMQAGQQGQQAKEKLAAKLVGRWRDGTPLTLSPETNNASLAETNDFGYADFDRHGEKCPAGAHIRRVNPRDSLGKHPQQSLRIANRHRLLRRSRLYDYGDDVGIVFTCFNVSFSRQFEHVQETWINGHRPAGTRETDPLVGVRQESTGDFSYPSCPVRKTVSGLNDFVAVTGGGYFFFPALDVFAMLTGVQ